jgi:hypothetical protein
MYAAVIHRPTHFYRGLQLPTHRRPFGLTKNLAAQLRVKLNARHARRLA